MPGGQNSSQGGASGQQPGGQGSPGQAGQDGGQQQPAGAAGQTASTAGGQPGSQGWDTAQGGQQPSTEIDFSEQQGSAGGASGSREQAANNGGQPGGQTGGQQPGSQSPGQPGGGGQTGDGRPGSPSASSYQEQVAEIERQLEGSMSEYDGMILRERRNVLAKNNEEGAEEQVETFDRSVAYYEEGDLSQAGGQQGVPDAPPAGGGTAAAQGGMEQTGARNGGQPGGSNAGAPGRANDKAYAPPADVPSGDDDDVVARQIREAAMYEDDPELREKLWEEYRKYKEQTR